MAAPGNVAAGSVQCMWPLVAKAVSLEPKNTFVIPRRVPCLKGRHITDLSRTKTEEAKEGNASRKPTESLLSELDCVSLADRVVRRAKERLDRRQKKHPNTIARPNRSEAELRLSVDHGKPTETTRELQLNTTNSYNWKRQVDSSEDARRQRVKQIVYLSEVHSHTPCSGVPSAPPVTPRCDFKLYNIPSLHNEKSQKQLKNRLEEIGTAKQADTAHTVKAERDKKLAEIKVQQRSEIYALNKYMTEFEERNLKSQEAAKV